MSEILRATVVLIREDVSEPRQTMRVPMTDDTTVLRLAKDALHRYQQQQQQNSKSIGVTKVFVENDNAELFIHDKVNHVVNIKEEKICLLLRQKAAPVAPAPPAPAPVPTQTVQPVQQEAPRTVPITRPPTVNEAPQTTATSSPTRAKHVTSVATSPPSAFKHVSRSQPMPAAVPVASPPNAYVTRRTPVTLPRALETREDSPPTTRRRIESSEKGSTPEAARVEDVDRMSPTTRRAYLKQKQEDGWGAEAHKSFASNYVSDPEKLARELRKQNRAQKGAGTSKSSAMDCDSSSSSQKSAEARTTEVSAARALFEPQQPEAPKIPGWGPLASKFFDADTYMDNPSKATLSSLSLANDGPIRARRF